MNPWERHRPAFVVFGVFVGLGLLLWFFWLRGTDERFLRDRNRRTEAQNRVGEFFSGDRRVEDVLQDAARANEALRAAFDAESAGRLHVFQRSAVVPAGEARSLFLANELVRAERAFVNRLSNENNINIEKNIRLEARETGHSLGLAIEKDEAKISDAYVADTVRKMEVVERFQNMLAAAAQSLAGASLLDDAATTGAPPANKIRHFDALIGLVSNNEVRSIGQGAGRLLEHRLTVTLRLTYPGLEALLDQCATREHFHFVRSLGPLAPVGESGTGTPVRQAEEIRRPLPERQVDDEANNRRTEYERVRYLNYYEATLTLATLSGQPSAEPAGSPAKSTPRPPGFSGSSSAGGGSSDGGGGGRMAIPH